MASEQMRSLLEMRRKAPRRVQRPTVEQQRASLPEAQEAESGIGKFFDRIMG